MPDLIAASETTHQVVDSEAENKNVPLLANDPILIEVEKSTGLRITGGADFDMPITVFYVNFTMLKIATHALMNIFR
jgi:hypothetical protein